jgi:hypothetical protein
MGADYQALCFFGLIQNVQLYDVSEVNVEN